MASDRDPVTVPATPSVQASPPTTGIGRNGRANANSSAGDPAKRNVAAATNSETATTGAARASAAAGPTAIGARGAAHADAAGSAGARPNPTATTSAAATVNPSAASGGAKTTGRGANQSTDGTQPQVLVNLLNKHLNDSGRPDQFRIAPNSGAALIQQINPATGAVVGEFAASEFPALARSVGVAGALIDGFA